MIEKIGISFDISSYKETQKAMFALEKQIQTMTDVVDQLVIMKVDTDNKHYYESCKFEKEFQQMVLALLDITHGQDVESLERGSFKAPLTNKQVPQLPVLALKPD